MNSGSRSVTLATIALLVIACLGGGYRLWQHGQRSQSDLVIQAKTGSNQPTQSTALNSGGNSASAPIVQPGDQSSPNSTITNPTTPTELVIHVAGAVTKPGVYHLPASARVEDAIAAAGGSKKTADLDALNLAAHLEDGTQLFVPGKTKAGNSETSTSTAGKTTSPVAHAGYSSRPSTAQSAGATGDHPPKADKLRSPKDGTVNLNSASAEQLQRLPGVGPSTAISILEHRKEIGKFETVEQIQDVKGIGPKKFDKMKAFLRVR